MKNKVNKKKNRIVIFILLIFICGNAFAAIIGAPNIFFAIKNLTKDDVEVNGKEETLLEAKKEVEKDIEKDIKEDIEDDVEEKNEESKEKNEESKGKNEVNSKLSETDKIFKELISEYEGKVYEDGFGIKYDIKSIEAVKTEFSVKSVDKTEELYKCNLTYKTSTGKKEIAELAMIKTIDSNKGELWGTYLNYTGSTAFTKFVGLYQESETEDKKEVDSKLSATDKIFKELISEYEGKVYEDGFGIKYDIKSIEAVETEFSVQSVDKTEELYKCNLTYKTSTGKKEIAELAMIKNIDSNEGELWGTYLNYTGSTAFTRFVGLYQESETEY